MKLRAGALSYALFVGVVTAILCFLMIVLVQFNRQYFQRMDLREKVMDNCMSGVALGLAEPRDGKRWEDLFGDGGDSVRIKRAYWGLYRMVSCEAKAGPFREVRSGLFGYYSAETEALALVLPDRNNTLKLAGSALIRGDAQLSQRGLAAAYIEGKNYSRDKQLYGNLKQSEDFLPKLEQALIENIGKRLEKIALEEDSLVSLAFLEKVQSRGFEKTTLLGYVQGNVRLTGELSGNIVVKSSGQITVEAGAQLKDILLVARHIRVSKGFKGALHLLASDSIVLEEGSVLHYPSSAVLINKALESDGQILVKNGAQFNGLALYQSAVRQEKNQASIKIEEGAVVRGQLYADRFVEHRGKLEGTLFASGLILITPAGVYQNHLLDGEIDRAKLVSNFGGLAFQHWESKPILITWL